MFETNQRRLFEEIEGVERDNEIRLDASESMNVVERDMGYKC